MADEASIPNPPSGASTELAVDRTLLARERTLMAWTRTATSLISFGFTICTFFEHFEPERLHRRFFGAARFSLLPASEY